jgi:hypothetical protein
MKPSFRGLNDGVIWKKNQGLNSASDAFTDNHTDSEPEGIDTSWLYTTVEEQDKAMAERRYRRRRIAIFKKGIEGV